MLAVLDTAGLLYVGSLSKLIPSGDACEGKMVRDKLARTVERVANYVTHRESVLSSDAFVLATTARAEQLLDAQLIGTQTI